MSTAYYVIRSMQAGRIRRRKKTLDHSTRYRFGRRPAGLSVIPAMGVAEVSAMLVVAATLSTQCEQGGYDLQLSDVLIRLFTSG